MARIAQPVEMIGIDEIDDLHMARQQPLHQLHRPGFQRFGQQRMVGIGYGFLRDVPRLRPAQMMHIQQNAHEFGHGNGGMCVIELNGDTLRQAADIAILLHMAAQKVSQRGRRKEIFLPQTQFLPRRCLITGVENFGNGFGLHLFGERADIIAAVEGIKTQRVGCARRPQPQCIDMTPAPARHRRIIGHGLNRFRRMPGVAFIAIRIELGFHIAAKADGVIHLWPLEFPRVAKGQPVLGIFLLPAILDHLPEQAIVIAYAIAIGRHRQCGHTFHETGGEAAKAAIAKGRIRLHRAQCVEVNIQFLKGGAHRLGNADIAQRVKQQPSDEKFKA